MIETKFKQTEIGLIPEDWEKSSVGETFLHVNSNTLSRDCLNYESGIVRNVHYGDVLVKFGEIVDAETDKLPYINDDTEITINPNMFLRSGDVIVADTAEDETVGKATELINVNGDIVAGLHTIVNRPKQDLFSQKYLGYFFNSSLYHNQLLPHMQGIKVLSLSKKAIDSTIVVYPKDKQEQSRIAEALSGVDKLISSLSKMIEKKRLIKQGAMQQLLTGKKRLPGFDGEWVEMELGELLKYEQPQLYIVQDTEYLTTGIPVLTAGKTFILGYTCETKGVYKDVPIILFDDFTTASKYVNFKFKVKSSAAKILSLRDRKCNLRLIYELMQMIDFPLADHQRYWISEYSHIKIWLPDDYDEQDAIANVFTTMDNEIESLEEERDKYIRLKEGMMQKLLTGQIRLVEAETKRQELPKAKAANVYFKRSVLAAEIADRLCEEKTFGHVKMEKLIFLTEHLCHIDIDSHYHRDAAGPYDNRALRSIDSQMKKQKWFEAKKEDKGYRYIPMQNRGGHKKYFEKYYADVLPMFEKIIDTFRSSTTEQCEIVATLYSAWDDLLQRHRSFTDDDILNEVLNNWHESKKRISRNRWQTELEWMRANGFMPQTENN